MHEVSCKRVTDQHFYSRTVGHTFSLLFFSYTRAKDNSAVYAIVLEWPENDLLNLGSPKPGRDTKVTWLGYRDPIEWKTTTGGGIALVLPRISMTKIPCQYAWVFKLTGLQNMQE